MAKRTRSTRARPAPAAPVAAPVAPPPDDLAGTAAPVAPPPDDLAAAAAPARRGFWLDFEISWATWTVFRVVFFGLHAVDAFQQIGHAPRYGAGGFNVQQLPGALLPDPTRTGMTFVYGALCVLFALIAQGTAVRWALPVATALYGYAYFVSQLDSYQHHYLMWLVLLLLCFVPTRPAPTAPGARGPRLRAWALRLVLVQLAIVYLWAAIAKIDPVWLDGSALARQIHTAWIRTLVAGLGAHPVAIGVIAVELILAATIWSRRLWWVALPLGVGLHVGIELIGLDIGLFSYFMLALYLLRVPDAVYLALTARLAVVGRSLDRIPVGLRLAVGATGFIAALVVVVRHPLPLGKVAGLAAVVGAAVIGPALGAGAAALARRLRIVALMVAPLAGLLTVTGVAADHFRTWAGAARRLGLVAEERAGYQGLLAVDPASEYAHYYLGQLALKAGQPDAAIAHFRAAQAGEPRRARSYLSEAGAQQATQHLDLARAAIDRGLAIDPGNAELQARRAALASGHDE